MPPDAGTPDAERAEVLVSVTDEYLEQPEAVADELRSAGMDVSQVMTELGIVTGWVDPGAIERLAGLRGVASVERSREYRLPPPDAPVQ